LINSKLGFFLLAGYIFYLLLIGLAALFSTKSAVVAFLSIPAAIVQLVGYGAGFFDEMTKFLR
jgi:hypothetical protein